MIENLMLQYGFPSAMCIWFMYLTEKTIKANTTAINNLVLVIKQKLK